MATVDCLMGEIQMASVEVMYVLFGKLSLSGTITGNGNGP
jgi:hypothetical protein